jgi:hypothetical protein
VVVGPGVEAGSLAHGAEGDDEVVGSVLGEVGPDLVPAGPADVGLIAEDLAAFFAVTLVAREACPALDDLALPWGRFYRPGIDLTMPRRASKETSRYVPSTVSLPSTTRAACASWLANAVFAPGCADRVPRRTTRKSR